MRKFLAVMLLAGACCLVFSREAKAEVNVITDVSYYEPTNSIFAWAEVIPDYDTLAYYCFDDWGYVRNNDDVVDSFWGGSCDGESYYQGFFPYDPDADYTVEVYPQLIVKHWIPSPGDGYDDYYNYIQWATGDSVDYPHYFGFSGPGPEVSINTSSILLGAVYSFFTEGGLAGQPDHVKVVSDTGQTLHSPCGFPIRELEYQAVDSVGRRVSRGRISTRERFYDANPPNWEIGGMWSTCTPGWVTPGGCGLHDPGGKWPDLLYPGNDSNCSSPCGAQPFIQKWIWCPRGKPPKVLTTNTLHLTSGSILINRVVRYNSGDELR